MPAYSANVCDLTYQFDSLKVLLAKATPPRSGDELAGVCATSNAERLAAKMALAEIPLRRFLEDPLVDPACDNVSKLIETQHCENAFTQVANLTVGGFRDWLLQYETTGDVIKSVSWGLTPEMAAAVSKLMRNQDLILVASKIRNVTRFRNTIGLPGCLSVRIQPNHPTDHPQAGTYLDIIIDR